MSWDQFHLMMTNVTTAELTEFYKSLSNFIITQLSESQGCMKDTNIIFDLFDEMKQNEQSM